MELKYSEIKKMDVVSVDSGKNLGRVFDLLFTYPQGKLEGFYVTGCRAFKFCREEQLIKLSDVVKVGEDVILVREGGVNLSPQMRLGGMEKDGE